MTLFLDAKHILVLARVYLQWSLETPLTYIYTGSLAIIFMTFDFPWQFSLHFEFSFLQYVIGLQVFGKFSWIVCVTHYRH